MRFLDFACLYVLSCFWTLLAMPRKIFRYIVETLFPFMPNK